MNEMKKVRRSIGSWTLLMFALSAAELRGQEARVEQANERGLDSLRLTEEVPSLDRAAKLLAKTDVLESAYVGFVLSRSVYLEALMPIVESSDAANRLRQLFEEGSLPGKMYALIGMQLLDDSATFSQFFERAEAYKNEEIRTYDGCILSKVPAEQALQRIKEGEYRQNFQDAWQESSQDPL